MTNPSLSGKEPRLSSSEDAPLTSNEPALSLERLLPGFREAFTSQDRATRTRLIDELTSGSEGAVIALLQLLRGTTDSRTRQRCAALLGQIGDERAVPTLIEVLDDPDVLLRRSSVWALGQLGSLDAVDPLVRLLDRDSDHRVLISALQTLSVIVGAIRDVRLLPLMFRLAEHPNLHLANEAEKAMRQLGQACSLRDLIPYLHAESDFQRQWAGDQFVRHSADPEPADLPLLERLLEYPDYPEVQYVALMKMSTLNDERVLARIIESLHHPDSQMQYTAMRLVRDLRLNAAADTLFALHAERALSESYEAHILIEAIAAMDDPRVIPFLLDRVEHHNSWRVRELLPQTSLDALLARLERAQGEARINLIKALHHYTAPIILPMLLDIARTSPAAEERDTAVQSIDLSAHPHLFDDIAAIMFNDPDDEVKSTALWCIAYADELEQCNPTLRSFLNQTEDEMLRAKALCALFGNEVPDACSLLEAELKRFQSEEALERLVRWFNLLGDDATPLRLRLYAEAKTTELRRELVNNLHDETAADERLVEWVLHVMKHDPDPETRSNALSNLYYAFAWNATAPPPDRLIDAMLEALNDDATYNHGDEEYHVSYAASWYLSRIERADVQAALAAYEDRHRRTA